MEGTRLNFKSICGGYNGDTTNSKKRISTLEVELAKLQQIMVYLVKQQHNGLGILAPSAIEHGIPGGKVPTQQAIMNTDPTKEASTSRCIFLVIFFFSFC
jgi:hypothetical protein